MRTATRIGGLLLVAALVLAGCRESAPAVRGTLEWDSIVLPAPASEPILAIAVREGDTVEPGDEVLRLDARTAEADVASLRAQVEQGRQGEALLRDGAREEDRRAAEQVLVADEARLRQAQAYHQRLRRLAERQLVSRDSLDAARAAEQSARAARNASAAARDRLRNGSRREDIAAAAAAADALQARLVAAEIERDRRVIRAPRTARIDDLPYRVGDRPQIGAPLAVLLVGERPYARVYVPQPRRQALQIGSPVEIHVEGRSGTLPGRVRAIASEASFTPYYALAGDDAARLSYLAEIEFSADAPGLAAGMPVQVAIPEPARDAGADAR